MLRAAHFVLLATLLVAGASAQSKTYSNFLAIVSTASSKECVMLLAQEQGDTMAFSNMTLPQTDCTNAVGFSTALEAVGSIPAVVFSVDDDTLYQVDFVDADPSKFQTNKLSLGGVSRLFWDDKTNNVILKNSQEELIVIDPKTHLFTTGPTIPNLLAVADGLGYTVQEVGDVYAIHEFDISNGQQTNSWKIADIPIMVPGKNQILGVCKDPTVDTILIHLAVWDEPNVAPNVTVIFWVDTISGKVNSSQLVTGLGRDGDNYLDVLPIHTMCDSQGIREYTVFTSVVPQLVPALVFDARVGSAPIATATFAVKTELNDPSAKLLALTFLSNN